jgi:NAD(P)H-flavin reductase
MNLSLSPAQSPSRPLPSPTRLSGAQSNRIAPLSVQTEPRPSSAGRTLADVALQSGRVLRLERVGDDLRELWIAAPGWQGAMPGQEVLLSLWEAGAPRAFSVADVTDGALAIVHRRRGQDNALLCRIQTGDRLTVHGLRGPGFSPPEDEDRILSVAGGLGIVPLAFYAARHRLAHMAITAGYRTRRQVCGFGQATRTGVPVLVSTEDGSVGRQGLVTDGLRDLIHRQHISRVLTCGPEPMVHIVATIAAECGLACVVGVAEG